ncbi:MAG: T9SS type A sorting domain-containing protein [Bacteroidetes bacterium]|nr:T9SS type A sorting domain-containing protein [Bacteroidota bacterium]
MTRYFRHCLIDTPSGNLVGTLTAGTGNKLVGNGKYVTHSSASNSSTQVWSFNWTAPAAGTGSVTFYGAFTVSKPVTKLSTLVIPEDLSTSIRENEILHFGYYPNPASENLTFDYSISSAATVRIELYNMAGQQCAILMDEHQGAGHYSKTVQLPGVLRNGIYILKYIIGENTVVDKLIVQR